VDGHTFVHLIQRYYPFRGGSEYYFQSLSEQFVDDGAEVHVVTTDAWDLEYFWDPSRRRVESERDTHNGVNIHRVAAKHLPFSNFTHRAIRRGMGELSRLPLPGKLPVLRGLSRFGPWLPDLEETLEEVAKDADLIHPANIALESMISKAAGFADRRDIPLVVTPKLHLGENERSAVRRYYTMPHQLELLRRARMVMTQTSLEAEFLTRFGVREDRLRVVGLGIDVGAVTGGDGARIREGLGIHGPMVLALGAAAYDKGTVHLCQAIVELNSRRSEPVTLVVAGPIISNFQQFADDLTPDERAWIRVLGYVEDDTRADLLAAADVLALPSRTEAFGYVFLEAWANGKPVIGARAGGIPAVIDDEVDGLLVDFGDVDGLARAIESLIDDPNLSRSLGDAGRRKVVDRRTWYAKVRAVYADVLGVAMPEEGENDERSAVDARRSERRSTNAGRASRGGSP
jgi:glycogen synthase